MRPTTNPQGQRLMWAFSTFPHPSLFENRMSSGLVRGSRREFENPQATRSRNKLPSSQSDGPSSRRGESGRYKKELRSRACLALLCRCPRTGRLAVQSSHPSPEVLYHHFMTRLATTSSSSSSPSLLQGICTIRQRHSDSDLALRGGEARW